MNCKYLIVNDLDRLFGLWVNTVGFQSIQQGMCYPSADHPSDYFFNIKKGRILNEYQLLYITEGEGVFESKQVPKTKVKRGSLIMLYPNQWHSYTPLPDTGWNEYYIGFGGAIIDNMIQNSFFTQKQPILEVGFHENLVNLFSRAIQIAQDDQRAAQQYLAGIVLHILGKVLSVVKNETDGNAEINHCIEHAKIIMSESISGDINPKKVAEELNVSYSWFRKQFKAYTGYAPFQYIQELKITKAKQLLSETPLSIKEIAYTLNYNSTEHFFLVFKKKTGLTPSQYRNSHPKGWTK